MTTKDAPEAAAMESKQSDEEGEIMPKRRIGKNELSIVDELEREGIIKQLKEAASQKEDGANSVVDEENSEDIWEDEEESMDEDAGREDERIDLVGINSGNSSLNESVGWWLKGCGPWSELVKDLKL